MQSPRFTGVSFIVALLALFASTLGMAGCGGDPAETAETTPPAPECAAWETPIEGGGCCPPGLPCDMKCPPGEMPLEDGSCQAAGASAGVPPEACGEGFEPDGAEGCNAILPQEACPEGQMAVPGETECHEVADCGTGDYGDIPVDMPGEPPTQFVNGAYAGGDSDGTEAKPWTSIQDGVDAAASGAVVAVAAGSYLGDVFIHAKPVRLLGRCPSMVEVLGTENGVAAIALSSLATSQSEVRGVAIKGPGKGISISGPSGVVIDHVWIHDTAESGLKIVDGQGPAEAAVSWSLIESVASAGVLIFGAEVTIDMLVVRNTLAEPSGKNGAGIGIVRSLKRADVLIRRSLIDQSRATGVFVSGSDLTIEATVVRGTLPNGISLDGAGIGVVDDTSAGARANVTVRGCVVEANHDMGVAVVGSDATIEASVVRNTLPDGVKELGQGITAQDHVQTGQRANVTVRASLVQGNQGEGVSVVGSDVAIEASVVRANLATNAAAVSVLDHEGVRSSARVTGTVVEESRTAGVLVVGSDMTMVASVVRGTQPDEQGVHGQGIDIEDSPTTRAPSKVTLSSIIVEDNRVTGILVIGSELTLEGAVVRNNGPDDKGHGGWGLDVEDRLAGERGKVVVKSSLFEGNREMGIFIVGSEGTIDTSVVRDTTVGTLGQAGRGIEISIWAVAGGSPRPRASVTVISTLVERNHDLGIAVFTDATIRSSIVRGTKAIDDGSSGDGVTVLSETALASASIIDSSIDSNARAGIANFGAAVAIESSAVTCNGFDIEGEEHFGYAFTFAKNESNTCGCEDSAEVCHAVSAGISPPAPLDPVSPAP